MNTTPGGSPCPGTDLKNIGMDWTLVRRSTDGTFNFNDNLKGTETQGFSDATWDALIDNEPLGEPFSIDFQDTGEVKKHICISFDQICENYLFSAPYN